MTTSTASNVVPSEVGWQFVPQYYTFVNKEPHRLHCFYNKNSTFVHGTEGEDGKPCYGQQEIHKKITSLGFSDCKVFIHSVDAQSSANGGIIIQVIGEMSNHGDPWRKFVQTFFLAEQPNGYFVLNDIFRFLKEEVVEGDEGSETGEAEYHHPQTNGNGNAVPPPAAVPAEEAAAPAPAVEQPTPEPPAREPTPPPPAPAPAAVPAPAPPADEAPTTDVAEPAPTPAPEPAPAAPPAEPEAPTVVEPAPAPTPAPEAAAAPPPPATTTTTPAPPATTPAPTQPTPPSQPQPPAHPAPPAQPPTPAAPRSWASTAAANPKKWGGLAQDAKGVSEAVAVATPVQVSQSTSGSGAATPVQQTHSQGGHPRRGAHPNAHANGNGNANEGGAPAQGQGGHAHAHPHGHPHPHPHPAYTAATTLTTPQCFIKGVTEPISQTALSAHLTTRFGPLKELEIIRSKACAFAEFQSVEGARRAVTASLSTSIGGEGGVWVPVGGNTPNAENGTIRVVVETRKERGERPAPRPHRGGAPHANGHEGSPSPGPGSHTQGGQGGQGQGQGGQGQSGYTGGGRGGQTGGGFRGRGGSVRGGRGGGAGAAQK